MTDIYLNGQRLDTFYITTGTPLPPPPPTCPTGQHYDTTLGQCILDVISSPPPPPGIGKYGLQVSQAIKLERSKQFTPPGGGGSLCYGYGRPTDGSLLGQYRLLPHTVHWFLIDPTAFGVNMGFQSMNIMMADYRQGQGDNLSEMIISLDANNNPGPPIYEELVSLDQNEFNCILSVPFAPPQQWWRFLVRVEELVGKTDTTIVMYWTTA